MNNQRMRRLESSNTKQGHINTGQQTPAAAEIASLPLMLTSEIDNSQLLHTVRLQFAIAMPIPARDLKYDPITTLMDPPYTCETYVNISRAH
jgi:hypothetical protein